MMAYFTHKINSIIVRCNLIYFGIGTMLFLLLLIEQSDLLIETSLVFIAIASTINGLMLLTVLANMLLSPKDIKEHILAFVIALLNYPIALLYIHLIFIMAF